MRPNSMSPEEYWFMLLYFNRYSFIFAPIASPYHHLDHSTLTFFVLS